MILTCQRCLTKFRLSPGAIRPGGTTVRCSRCGTVFRAVPARARWRPGPPPGVSDEDYVLHGGPAPTPSPKEAVPGAAEAAAALAAFESAPAEAQPIEAPAAAKPKPDPIPEPEAAPAPPPEPPAPEPAEIPARPEPEPEPPPKAAESEPEPPSSEPEPEPERPAPPPEVAEAAPAAEPEAAEEPPVGEPAEEPWPEPQQPTETLAPPPPPPRPAKVPSRLEVWCRALIARRPPLALGALAAALLLVVGLLSYRAGIIGGGSADPKGTSRITFTGISGYFLKNDHDGIVYVVQGLARNGYRDKRARIRIKAALYGGASEPVREELVYAGNIFSREELQRTPLKEIATTLASPVERGSHSVVRPGATVPFMAVFGDLPDSLGEFSLEAAGSSRAASS